MSLTQRILIAMGVGISLGALLQWLALPQDHLFNAVVLNGFIDGGGRIFIALLKMLVVPWCSFPLCVARRVLVMPVALAG